MLFFKVKDDYWEKFLCGLWALFLGVWHKVFFICYTNFYLFVETDELSLYGIYSLAETSAQCSSYTIMSKFTFPSREWIDKNNVSWSSKLFLYFISTGSLIHIFKAVLAWLFFNTLLHGRTGCKSLHGCLWALPCAPCNKYAGLRSRDFFQEIFTWVFFIFVKLKGRKLKRVNLLAIL